MGRRFLQRIGLAADAGDARFASRLVLAGCAAYLVGFALFYPNAITNDDEGQYLRQAQMVLQARTTIGLIDPLTGDSIEHNPSRYPIGTAALMAPAVALFGWRGAYLIPLLGLLAATLLLARWLRDEGYSPVFALLLLGYPPTLVMGRVAMSDVPAAALVVAGLYCFWRGLEGRSSWWLGSGFLAGAGMVFRESNPIPFVPFYLGAVLRRDRNTWALVVGGLAGVGLRLMANYAIHGHAFYQKAKFHFAFDLVPEKLPLYLIATLVFVPGGLILSLCYRGRRWPELRAAIVFFVTLYLVQKYWTYATSDLKRLIITPRYLIPIVPVFAFAMAESVPRLWRALSARWEGARAHREAVVGTLLACWAGGVLIAAFAVHPGFHWWATGQGRIQETINANVDHQHVMLTNWPATRKFIRHDLLRFLPLSRHDTTVEEANALVERYGEVTLVFLDRSDSVFWRKDADENARFVAEMRPEPQLVLDETFSKVERLRIWQVRSAESDTKPAP